MTNANDSLNGKPLSPDNPCPDHILRAHDVCPKCGMLGAVEYFIKQREAGQMQDIIEKMAIAMHSAAFYQGKANVDDCKDIWREYAKAAIAAVPSVCAPPQGDRSEIPVNDGFDPDKARKDLKPEAWELLKKPIVQSLLYDINLLPEQITTGKHWFYMLSILSHMNEATKREAVDVELKDAFRFAVDWIRGLPCQSEQQYKDKKAALECLTPVYDAKINSIEGQKP